MQTTHLSLLVLMLVIVFLALVFYIIRLKRQRHFAQLAEVADLYEEIDDPDILAIRDISNSEFSENSINTDPKRIEEPQALDSEKPSSTISTKTPSAVLAVYVVAKNDGEFVGYELLQTLLASGFRFGEMSIFHRHEEANGNGMVLFSLASATEPGIFDINRIGGVRCKGLSLFMRLSEKNHNLTALNLMLDTAYQLAEELDGMVLDGNQEPMTHDMVVNFKQKVEEHLEGLEY